MLAGRGRGPFGVVRTRGSGEVDEVDDDVVLMGAGVAAGAASAVCASDIWVFGGSVTSRDTCMSSSAAADGVSMIVADESGVNTGGSAHSGSSLSSAVKGSARGATAVEAESVPNRGGRGGVSSREDFLLDLQRKLNDLLRGMLNLFPMVGMLIENDRFLAGSGSSFVESFHGSCVVCAGGVLSSVVP